MSTNILGIGPTLWLSRHLHMPRTTGPGQILYNTIRKSQDKFSEKKFFFSKMSAGSIHLSMQVGLNLDVDIAYTCFMGSWLKIRICRIARTYSLRSLKIPSTSKSCTSRLSYQVTCIKTFRSTLGRSDSRFLQRSIWGRRLALSPSESESFTAMADGGRTDGC